MCCFEVQLLPAYQPRRRQSLTHVRSQFVFDAGFPTFWDTTGSSNFSEGSTDDFINNNRNM
jgi:hypothetical protein